MPDEKAAVEAIEALIEELLSLGATDLVRDIHAAVARGATRYREDKKHEKVAFQAAFTPTEAFVVAVRHVVAALDALFMIDETRALLGKFGDFSGVIEITWALDRLQDSEHASVLFPSLDEYIEPIRHLPKIEPQDYTAVRATAAKLRNLCDQISGAEG